MQISQSKLSLSEAQASKILAMTVSGCPYAYAIDDGLFFKPFMGMGANAAMQHIRTNALAYVAPGHVARSLGVVEINQREGKIRILSAAESVELAVPQLETISVKAAQYGIVLERVHGTAIYDIINAPYDMESAGRLSCTLSGLLRGGTANFHDAFYSKLSRIITRLHNNGYAHGDLAPQNIFLVKDGNSDFEVVLIDPQEGCYHSEGYCEHFGMARGIDEGWLSSYSMQVRAGWGHYQGIKVKPIRPIRHIRMRPLR